MNRIKLLCQLTQFDANRSPQFVDFIPRLRQTEAILALKNLGTAFGIDITRTIRTIVLKHHYQYKFFLRGRFLWGYGLPIPGSLFLFGLIKTYHERSALTHLGLHINCSFMGL